MQARPAQWARGLSSPLGPHNEKRSLGRGKLQNVTSVSRLVVLALCWRCYLLSFRFTIFGSHRKGEVTHEGFRSTVPQPSGESTWPQKARAFFLVTDIPCLPGTQPTFFRPSPKSGLNNRSKRPKYQREPFGFRGWFFSNHSSVYILDLTDHGWLLAQSCRRSDIRSTTIGEATH